MIGSSIAKRYARAFFDIAAEEGTYETLYDELSRFASVVEKNEGLKEFLANPIFDQTEKRAVVDQIIGKVGISPLTANFLRLLTDKRRIGVLSEVEDCYRELMDSALSKARVRVRTAYPLSDELSGRLRGKLEQMTGKKVEMTVEEDAGLLGGIVVQVGDTLYDGSVRTQLNNIRNLLGEER